MSPRRTIRLAADRDLGGITPILIALAALSLAVLGAYYGG